MDLWLRVYKHLLPTGKAWRLTIDKTLRQFFEGLTGLPEDSRQFFDEIWRDLDPQTTRALEEFEQQFALETTGLTEQERRDRLDGAWKALGGQDPRYIEDTLRAAGFDVYVHEWWVPIPGRPGGGSINGDVSPVARNPNDYLYDGSQGSQYLMYDGGDDSQDGDDVSQDGGTSQPLGYPLVNKLLFLPTVSDGSSQMQDGGADAQDGGVIGTYTPLQYILPTDPAKFPYFLYIGGQNFPDLASIPLARRDEFEKLCLKICPLEQWLGILVNYS
jgi:hypothetical protein